MSERGGAPAGFPKNARPVLFEDFQGGLNTKTLRPGIKDSELSICDGWMPVAPNALRTLWGIGSNFYTVPSGTVEWFDFGNIGDTRYLFVLNSDGGIKAINRTNSAVTTVMPASTIASPGSILGFSQWGSQYSIFAAPQTNGYWLWDGTNLFTAGTAGPTVDITDGGANYTSAPTVNTHGGAGSGVVLSAVLDNQAVSQVMVTNPGGGFVLNDQVVLLFTGSGTRSAIGQAVLTNGVITSVTLLAGGQGFQSSSGVQTPPTVVITDGTGSGAVIIVSGQSGGIITSLQIVSGGSGYSAPAISFTGGSGTGAEAACYAQDGVVTSITLIDGGLGYQSTPQVNFVSATGAGADANATVGAGGAITQVQVTAGGSGYTGDVWVTFSGGNGPAVATLEMMPFGISGTWVEVYAGHVWIGNGAAPSNTPPQGRVIFSSSATPVDFGDSGGAFLDNNSFARVGYFCGKQTNGFLYLIADSSLDYISGVQTSTPSGGTAAITTFNNQNADPQNGSPWPSSVQVYNRNIVFANPSGVFVSLGGAVTKVSTPLDNLYGTVDITHLGDAPSAVSYIFGNLCYMLLLPVIDQVTQQQVEKLLIWDGKKWFTSQQDVALTYVQTEEFSSIIQAWGTDGKNIFRIFDAPSSAFTKTAQSKLWAQPGYSVAKAALVLYGITQANFNTQPLDIGVDNESGLGTGTAAVAVGAPTPGPNVFNQFGPMAVGQNGYLLGLTLTTIGRDMTVMSVMLVEQDYPPEL